MERPTAANERVLPSLLDRLTTPSMQERLTGARTATDAGGVREREFRESVIRDLEWLFNAASPLGLLCAEQLRRYPCVASSVLNFGLRGVFGRVVHDPGVLEEEVKVALARFEPRLKVEHQSLRLSQQGQLVEIEIEGTLLNQHATRRLWVRTDLETMVTQLTLDTHE